MTEEQKEHLRAIATALESLGEEGTFQILGNDLFAEVTAIDIRAALQEIDSLEMEVESLTAQYNAALSK